MKRHWLTYLLSICAALSSCTDGEVLIDRISEPTAARQVPISFASSYVDHAATRHTSELREHLSTMGVWGWYSGTSDNYTPAFEDQFVAYNADSARWEYKPLQYWQEGNHYSFFAYAPHQRLTDAKVDINPTTRMISIKGVTLHGYNLQDIPSFNVKEQFAGTPDTDWMVARAGQTATGTAGMDIEFMMQHILAKLNVRIKTDLKLLLEQHITQLTADSVVIGTLAAKGDFVQQLTHTPLLTDPAQAAINEWAVSDTILILKETHASTIEETPVYLIESLVLPQHISSQATATLYYSYHYDDGHKEECRYQMPLTEAFTRFASGHNYTLTFTLSPKRIVFEAGAANWEKNL